jgi:predicted acetylornithine/succinylornithine family transaminase
MAEGGPQNEGWIARGQKALLGNYRPQPIVLVNGQGARVEDADGTKYIDFASGIAVSSLGHNHPVLVKAITDQASRLLHTANIVWNQPAIALAEKLVAKSFAERVFFCNSGAEAVEAMLKLARKVFFDRGEGRFEIISFQGSFHGRTMGALTATGQEKYRVGFEPLLPGVRTVPYGDVHALEQAMTERTAAVLLEAVQGEGGVVVPPAGFVKAVREITQKHGCLMLLDEVQSGVGRTGTLWAYEQEGCVPDAMSVAKGIAGGLPLGVMLTTNALGEHLGFGSHGSTFGGNPVACAAGNAVMDVVGDPAFLARVKSLGEHMLARMQNIMKNNRRVVVDVRARGLWGGIETNQDLSKIARRGLQKGVLLNVIANKIIRIAPPLVVDKETLDAGLDVIDELLNELVSEPTRA